LSPRQLARIAGALYLINIVLGAFAIGFIQATLLVLGDPAATAHNIQTHETLYRLGSVAQRREYAGSQQGHHHHQRVVTRLAMLEVIRVQLLRASRPGHLIVRGIGLRSAAYMTKAMAPSPAA